MQGWLARSHGFTADALLSADVVTADGVLRTVSAEDHTDLFWALRGGGGNFGVVTTLTLRLQPLVQVYSGTTMYPVERAPEVLAAYCEWAVEQPDELKIAVSVMWIPEVSRLPGTWHRCARLGVSRCSTTRGPGDPGPPRIKARRSARSPILFGSHGA